VDLIRGSKFAGYRVERLLGQGGMGAVYLARPTGSDAAVALKVIRADVAGFERYEERFSRELRLAASLEHPHLVPVREIGEFEGTPFLAMRYVDGTDLERLLDRTKSLHPRHSAALISQVASALGAAHELELVHRDVKPGNVLLETPADPTDLPHAYLTDFGLSKHAESTSGLTATGRWVGTTDYAAPEQIQAQEVDARTDVYALGCVLYQLLTGEVPFVRAREVDKMLAHVSDPPPVPSAFPEIPQDFDPIVLRALAKDPAERYETAEELAREAQAAAEAAGPAPAFPEI
jgi:serine/threonine protein kinase